MSIPTLWIMVGLPAAGKSTVAKKIAKENDTVIISTDEIRAEVCDGDINDQSKNTDVFAIFYRRIRDGIENGMNVVADATNISIKSRKRIIECVDGLPCYKVAYVIAKDIPECIADNSNRKHPVPEDSIIRMWRNFQIPFLEEGFDDISVHMFQRSQYGLRDFIGSCLDLMHDFHQDNPHHTMDLYEHSAFTTYKMTDKLSGMMQRWIYFGSLLHDVGKLFTKTFDENGVAHYYNHESVGAYYLLCNRHGFDMCSGEFLNMLFLVNYHMFPADWKSQKSIRKWRQIFGEEKFELLKLFHECDQAR